MGNCSPPLTYTQSRSKSSSIREKKLKKTFINYYMF
jgi:hypothetical protein